MNNAIHEAFINALLAEASYVEGLLPGQKGDVLASKLASELTDPLAQYVGTHFSVVKQVTDPASGFSVTVFQDLTTAQKYISFRGTQSLVDWVADVDIFIGQGAAYFQVKAMVNWYLRASTPEGAQAVQLADTWHIESGQYVFDTYLTAGTGEIAGSPDWIVNGHSLGGHLTTAFARLFGNTATRSFTYNGCGFLSSADNIFAMIERSLGSPSTAYPGPARQTNVFAEHGVNIATNDVWTSQFGQRVAVFNEEGTGVPNHQMYKLTDALALCDVMGAIDEQLSLADATRILDAGSANAPASLETVLDALRRLLRTTDQTPTQIGDAADAAPTRVDYHTKLAALRVLVEQDSTLRGRIVSLVDTDAAALQAGTQTDVAYRYALKELNPFAIVGNNDLYAPHNQSGELDLFSSRTATPAGMTSWYLADRAAFLVWKNIANTNDATGVSNVQSAESWRFVDLPQNYSVTVTPPAAGGAVDAVTHRAVFGGDSTDVLLGGNREDRLYGGLGTDFLSGNAGDDYLEGGAGLDVYAYRAQKNLVLADTNDGNDTIRDTDGKGVLRYTFTQGGLVSDTVQSTVIAEASVKLSDTQWQSADGKFTYAKQGNDLVVAINGDAGGSLTLKDFHDGDFGIRLRDARSNPTTSRDILGEQDAARGYDDLGNPIGDAVADRDDRLYGSRDPGAPGDKISSGGGNDVILADRPNNSTDNGLGNADWILAGAGRDDIDAGAGNDLVEAGADGILNGDAGGDLVYGGLGDDTIYGDVKVSLADAIAQGNLDNATHVKGDFLSGGAGDDWVVGARANDVLAGGGGEDLLIGGAGDDTLYGDAGDVATQFAWTVTRTATGGSYQATLNGVATLDNSAGGADAIYGGAGADWAFGGAGDDFIDGGNGADVLFGEAGADVILGGDGNDVLIGDNPGVTSAADEGADYLDGGSGDDIIQGDGGDDILIGGAGNDTLSGGSGKDTYLFNRGDGRDQVFDDSTGNEASVLVFGAGFDPNNLTIRPGSMRLDFGNGDSVELQSFNPYDPASQAAFESLNFADGTVLSFQDVLDRGFTITGTAGDDNGNDAAHPMLVGTAFKDRIAKYKKSFQTLSMGM